jgi:hypothetical protein
LASAATLIDVGFTFIATKSLFTIALAWAFIVVTVMCADPPEPVLTEWDRVQRAVEGDLSVSRGIPFTAPPIDDLRRRPPRPAAKREGVRETVKFVPDPYQDDGSGNVSEGSLKVLNKYFAWRRTPEGEAWAK